MCIKRNNPEECVECEFRTTVLKDKATNSKLPKFTVRTERDIIGHWMEAKFTNYKKYKRFGWLLSIFPLVILYFILIEFGGEATVSLKDTAARRFSIYCLIFSLLILAFHLIQFGLAIFWILPDVKKKTNRHITGRFIFWFFLHVLICAGTAMLFSKIGGEGWVWYASLFFFVFLAPSIWWYPYCLLARCPYPNGIYLEYWTHGKDSGGWEYNDNLYSKRIWDNGQLVFWKQWGRTEEEFYKVEECWVGEQRSLQQFGYNPDGKSNSPLTRTPLVYRLGFDERKNAFAWTIFKKKAADTVTDQI
jgi:hypothetical protein